MSVTIAAIGEHALIERLRQKVGLVPPYVVLGIGDDAAVVTPERGTVDVLTTDCLVEGIHFRRDWTAAADIGYKALSVNLSDLAAMGATPRACLLGLVLPPSLPLADFDELVDGFAALARASGAVLVGGNLTRSPGPVVIDVTAIGAARRRRLLRRDTARPGDELYVSGAIGGAAAGLAWLGSGTGRSDLDALALAAVARYERPLARCRLGSAVARSGSVVAAIDLSDGLASAARTMAAASGVGVVVEGEAIPVDPGARHWAARAALDAVLFALEGGEDYELAFAVRPRLRSRFLAAAARSRGLAVTRVGRFVPEPGAWLERQGSKGDLPSGFRHF
jgi:thiamine-monophosphate kinase